MARDFPVARELSPEEVDYFVENFDHHDPRFGQDPWPVYEKMVREWGDVLPTQSVCLRVPVFPPSESDWARSQRLWQRPRRHGDPPPTSPANTESTR